MPRHKPLQNKPLIPRKQNNEFKTEKNFDYCYSIPCVNSRCSGFMFLLTVKYGDHGPAIDELECFTCRRIRKLGQHNPNRSKPVPIAPKNHSKRSKNQG